MFEKYLIECENCKHNTDNKCKYDNYIPIDGNDCLTEGICFYLNNKLNNNWNYSLFEPLEEIEEFFEEL